MQRDVIYVNGKWSFNSSVSACFDDMLSRSIPDYETMRDVTLRLAKSYLKDTKKINMLDLGCSNGINIEQFVKEFDDRLSSCIGIDKSIPMIAEARTRLKDYHNVHTKSIDIVDYKFDINKYNIITSILTLQFIPIEYRQRVLCDIYNSLKSGGMFIFIEKVIEPSYMLDNLYVDSYYKLKQDNGYSEEQIYNKKKSLEGVLVPVTSKMNIDLLEQAGFKNIGVFWKCLNFEGYIAIK